MRHEAGSPGWWLNLQVSFALAGGAVWLGGTLFEQDFIGGVGAGLILAALLLRMGRKDAEGDEAAD